MPKSTPYTEQVGSFEEENLAQVESSGALLSSRQKDDETRQEVAKKFVRYYFELLTLIIIGVPVYNIVVYRLTGSSELTISFKDAILTYSAVVGPTVGLVVAYYFESKSRTP